MGKIAYIFGETFVYWQSIILTLAVVTAVGAFLALYLWKGKNILAGFVAVPLALVSAVVLARLTHWYCQSAAYESFTAAMTEDAFGGYALMGVFAGCMLTAIITFSVRMVKAGGWKKWYIGLWVGILALLVGAGYMEYYVQRHGDQAAFAYTNMAICLTGIVLITLVIRAIAVSAEWKNEE